jgi:formate-dependent nitrite reductase membrane component NrfD
MNSGGGDGRNIDERLGILEGEGAQQVSPARRYDSEGAPPFAVWDRSPAEAAREDATYYDRPAIKEPVWIWAVPAYFFAGGAAGAALTLGAAVQLTKDPSLRALVVRCRALGAAGSALGAALLVLDLGRPARFLNMLRVFRPSSPLNLGSWLLAAVVPVAASSAILSRSRGAGSRLGDAAGAVAGVLGMPLAGYTAVLLSGTVVPVWRGARRTLPVLFVASSMSSAASLLGFADAGRAEAKVVHRFDVAGSVAELAATLALQREVSVVQRVARPLKEGPSGTLWKSATVLGAAGLAVSMIPGTSRRKQKAAGLLGAAGGLVMRFAIFHAGKASARDPRATFEQQRAGPDDAP